MTIPSAEKRRIRRRDQSRIPLLGQCVICGATGVETSRHNSPPIADVVRSLFDYYDGALYWKVHKGTAKLGDLAGTVRDDERRQIGINGKRYKAHRLIFLWHHGYLPEFLDHIDGDPTNNNIDNLRKSTGSQNQWNRKKDKSRNGKPTLSIYKGVTWHKHREKWQAQIQINGEREYLGSFESEIDAAKAYNDAATELHDKFAEINECEVNL